MNIIFLTRNNPNDINAWSGTLYHVFNILKKRHHVEWMGGEVLSQVGEFKFRNYIEGVPNTQEKYVGIVGKILSERINRMNADVVFFGDNYLVAHLNIRIPIIQLTDTTYEQFSVYLNVEEDNYYERSLDIERLAVNNYKTHIYSSEWAKNGLINYYGVNPDKIKVVEFGANISEPNSYATMIDVDVCRLVFIGKNWKKKGGAKALNAYNKLKAEGFPCTLTIIGSVPDLELKNDPDLTIIPFLDKSKPEDSEQLTNIIASSHFLILPTVFDCYGIVFCEASAYGVPSIASNVGGVSQVVREGKNGYLLSAEATADDYADKIRSVFEDKKKYLKLRKTSRKEFETRLNWNVWEERVNKILEETVNGSPFGGS